MATALQDVSVQFCPSLKEIASFSSKKPDTCIKLFRDAAKWGDKANLSQKGIIHLDKVGSSLEACADFLSVRDMPQTAYELITEAEFSLKGCVTIIEKSCDLTVQACDVLSSLQSLGGVKIENTPLLSRISSACTLKSFSIKIRNNWEEISDSWGRIMAGATLEEREVAGLEFAKAWFGLFSKTAIFALAFFTFLPFVVDGYAVSSTILLMISTAGLIAETASFFIGNRAEMAARNVNRTNIETA